MSNGENAQNDGLPAGAHVFPGRRGRPHGAPFFRVGPVILRSQDVAPGGGGDGAGAGEAEDDMRTGFEPADPAHFSALQASTGLPAETCLEVLDEAGHALVHRTCARLSNVRVRSDGAQVVLATPTLTHHGVAALRRIVVRVRSNDQGWSSEAIPTQGTFENSHTWHELTTGDRSLLVSTDKQVTSEQTGPRHLVHRNRHARAAPERLEASFDRGAPIFQDLQGAKQPALLLVSRAVYPGWVNYVHYAQIELHFATTFDERELEKLFVEEIDAASGTAPGQAAPKGDVAQAEQFPAPHTIPVGDLVAAPRPPSPEPTE